MFDGVARFSAAVSVAHYMPWHLKYWNYALLMGRLGFPYTDEVTRLKNFAHQDDFARAATTTGVERKQRRTRLQRLVDYLHRSVWTEPDWQLRYNPWIRTQHFLKFMRGLRRR